MSTASFDMTDANTAFDAAVARHDAQLAERGLTVWVGAEPTFTDRWAQTPEWLNQALGGEKATRAQALIDSLRRSFPGGLLLHSVGRQYPGEDRPRWNIGLYRRRDGQPIWSDPPSADEAAPDPENLALSLMAEFQARGWQVDALPAPDSDERRLLLRFGPEAMSPDADDPRLARASVHAEATPAGGLSDTLAEQGLYLFILGLAEVDGRIVPRIELPQIDTVARFLDVLACLDRARANQGGPMPRITGYPPPGDASVAWTTVTPDPAVIEVNSAPSVDARDFLARDRALYAAAAEQGLAAYRLYYNGAVADSGGGGQITLGGPSPEASPFILYPRLLPSLIRFFNRHPALSYLYSHDYVGGGGQSARSDERGSDALDDLRLALTLLDRGATEDPEHLWRSLAAFLCDATGNSHRAEINIEKLWNPYLGNRGRLGLVEFRALRMQHSPERATALVCLLRAIVAMLIEAHPVQPLVDWGRDLHDRYALPYYLEQDLDAVLAELDHAGLGLDEPLRAMLRRDEFRHLGQANLPGCVLELRRALEFWPLLGDAASPEQHGGSRLIDASCARLELRLRPLPDGTMDWEGWRVAIAGIDLPMRTEHDARGALKVYGLRYRSFIPALGLHPGLGTQTPLRLDLRHPDLGLNFQVGLHEWRPIGGAYPGLPVDLADAAERRAERITVESGADAGAEPTQYGHLLEPGPYCLDLRYLG